MAEPIFINGVRVKGETSLRVAASSTFNKRRLARNQNEANELERQGYSVERNKHANGAYFAVIGKHPEHEVEVGRIFAENGFVFTLDREGHGRVKINGKTYILPSSDGHVEGFTHEIYALNGNPDARTVAEAIKHSYKMFRPQKTMNLQSEIAISIAPKGSKYRRNHIDAGVKEYKRQRKNGETKARPLKYLHVSEETRSIYYRDIK